VDFLREDVGLTGTNVGCEHGVCGACTILMNGETVRSCIMLAAQADGAELMTVEGLAKSTGELHPIQESFRDKHGLTVQLLADSEGEVCRLYEVLEERIVEGTRKFVVNRCTFIVDKQGTLRHILKVVKLRGHAQEVLKLVRENG